MARTGSTISVAILGDASKFKRALDDASGRLSKFGSSVGNVAGNVGRGFGLMTAAAGGVAVVGGKHLFDLGADLTSLDQKIGTVFSGDSLQQVENWADTVAARMGLTSTQAQGLAANAGDLLKPMGFTADQAADMSTEIIGLSGALSEWSGGQRSVEETAEILSKALLGERDSLKSLGISINQAEVDTKALQIAQLDGRDAINAQDKALATQQLILEKSTDAQDAFAAGGNQLVAAQNLLRARFGEITETLARRLLPVFNRAAGVVVELIDVFDRDGLAGVVRDLHQRFAEAWPAIRRQLGVWATGFVQWVQTVGPPFLSALGAWLANVASWFVDDALPVIVERLSQWADAFLQWAADVAPPLLQRLADLAVQLGEWFIDDALPVIVDKLEQWAVAFVNWATEVVPPLLQRLVELAQRLGEWFVNDGLPVIVEKLAQWAAAFIEWAVSIAPDVIAKLTDFAIQLGTWLLSQVPTLVGYLAEWTWAFVRWAGTDLLPQLTVALWQVLRDIGGSLVDLGGRLIDGAIELGKKIVDAIVDGIKAAPGALLNALESLIPGGSLISDAVGGVSGLIGSLSPFADGGIVTGPTAALIGEAGPEAVIPLNRANTAGIGGTVNVTVNMPPGADGADVVRALQTYARSHGGRVPILTGQL
jgi:hypothetical protein